MKKIEFATTASTTTQRHGRNKLYRTALLVALTCSAWTAAFAQTFELKVTHYLPPNHTINQELMRWADELNVKSNGRLKITVFPSGQMGPITRQFDLARTGVADAAFFLHGAVPGRFALTELLQLPFVFTPEKNSVLQKPLNSAEASVIATGLADQLTKEYEGTRILYVIASPNIGLFFNKATVRKPADMKGMRIRHNGPMPAKMIELWGATPASVAPVELSDALEKGTVNGMAFNYEAAQSFQVGPSIKSVAEINAYAVTFALVINSKKYDSLPTDLRKLVDDSTGVEGARRVGARYDEAEASGRKYMLERKVEIVVPTIAEQQAFRAPVTVLVKEAIDSVQTKGLAAQRFYDDVRSQVNAVKR